MTICVSHVGPHFSNIGYFEVYEGYLRYMEVIYVYGGYLRYMKVYEGPPMVGGDSPPITAPIHRCQR